MLTLCETLKISSQTIFEEQIVFPEIDYDKIDALRGMDITITTNAATNEEAEALLRGFNFPLKTK